MNLQRLVLAILEEAGEEELPTLLNTVRKRSLPVDEVEMFSRALINLIESDLVRIAHSRDPQTLRLVQLSKHESVELARELKPAMEWSGSDLLWHWKSDKTPSRLNAVLTKQGLAAASNVLSEDGWPADVFSGY